MNSFNLVDEKWIPCQLLNGSFGLFSLSEVLIRAHEIQTIVPKYPMEKISLSRLLLAILHRNFGPRSKKDWKSLWQDKRWDIDSLMDYFHKWHDRFDLFDEFHPFYQTINIDGEIRPINGYTFHLAEYHLASGNNATLFDHHTETDEIVFNYADAARLLVNAQSFAFGFRTYKDGPSARGVNFLLLGDNLFQTLLLNMVRYDHENPFFILKEDFPAWERENPFIPERTKPEGYLDYLTWQSRKILLHPENEKATIRRIQVDNGLKLDVAGDPYLKNPMMQYSKIEKPAHGSSPFRPLKFQEGRAIWRDSTSIIEINSSELDPPKALSWINECNLDQNTIRMNSIGIASDQGKVNFYLEELFTFPAIYLEQELLIAQLKTCLEQAEQVRKKLWGAINSMSEILLSAHADHENGRRPTSNDKQSLADHINAENQYWVQLELPFYQLLNDLPEVGDEAIDQWQQNLQLSVWKAFAYARSIVGNSSVALKASAIGERILSISLKNIFYEQEKEV